MLGRVAVLHCLLGRSWRRRGQSPAIKITCPMLVASAELPSSSAAARFDVATAPNHHGSVSANRAAWRLCAHLRGGCRVAAGAARGVLGSARCCRAARSLRSARARCASG